ncbi:MAG: HDOD domain-containing protein [Steroidobacteraceae bacterium]
MAIDNAEVLKAATALGVVGGSSQSVHRVLAALCDPGLGAHEIAAIVQRDPGLTARVLKVANSAYYGRSGQVQSVDQALILLGFDAVRGIAASACLDRGIVRRSATAAIQPDALAGHCLATALAAEHLARRVRPAMAVEAMIAGLLHDFGVLVQERLDPAGVAALIDALRDDESARPGALEPALVRVGHAECARIMFEAWGLPALITAAVAFHHDPLAAPDDAARDLAALTHLGMQAALDAGFAHPLEPRPLPDLRAALCARFALEPQGLAAADDLAEQVLLLRGVGD